MFDDPIVVIGNSVCNNLQMALHIPVGWGNGPIDTLGLGGKRPGRPGFRQKPKNPILAQEVQAFLLK